MPSGGSLYPWVEARGKGSTTGSTPAPMCEPPAETTILLAPRCRCLTPQQFFILDCLVKDLPTDERDHGSEPHPGIFIRGGPALAHGLSRRSRPLRRSRPNRWPLTRRGSRADPGHSGSPPDPVRPRGLASP